MVRMRQGGRESEVDADGLRLRIATGDVAEDATVLAEDGRWHPARQWFLETFVVKAPERNADTDYVELHRVRSLTMKGLATMLGVTGDSVHGVNTRAQNAVRDVLDSIDTGVCHRPIVASHHLDADGNAHGGADLAGDDGQIRVPDWGRPYRLPTDRPIEIPPWQDPATGGTLLPDFAPVQWVHEAAVSRRRRIAPPPGAADPAVAAARAQAQASAADARDGSGPGAPTDVIAAVQEIAQLRAKRRADRKASRAAQDAADHRLASGLDQTESARRTPTHAPANVEHRPDQHASVRADDATRLGVMEFGATPAATQSGGAQPQGAEPVIAGAGATSGGPSTGSGCLGCFGRLVLLMLVASVAWIVVEVALQQFVASELAASWKTTADDVPLRRQRSSIDGLIELGPRESLLPILVAFDPAHPEGVRGVASLLRWQREHGAELGLPSDREPRVVLLPIASAGDSELVRELLVLHGKGELVDAWPDLVGSDTGMGHEALERFASEVDLDASGLAALAKSTAARELERTMATMGRVFQLDPPFAVAVAGQALPADVVADPARLDAALQQAAATALLAARSEGPGAWDALLRDVPDGQAARWKRWIVLGERVAATEAVAGAKTDALADAGPHRLALPPETQTRGKPGSVQLVFVADLQCAHSRSLARRLENLVDDQGADVELAFVHRPITSLHPDAEVAARLAQAAAAQGAFWQVADWIFVHGRRLDKARLVRSLARKGVALDGDALESASTTSAMVGVVAAHIAWANAHGVTGTPTLFLDGRPLRGAVTSRALTDAVKAAVAARQAWQDANPGATVPILPAEAATPATL